jgi:hypothetical protein
LYPELGKCAGDVLQAPRVIAANGHRALVMSNGHARKVATRLARHADGPPDHAVSVAYTPEFEKVDECFRIILTGHRLDQGVLVQAVIEDKRVAAVHEVKLVEYVTAKGASGQPQKVTPKLDVPEIVKSSAEGVWLIPHDGMLVVSLGVNTAADANGKAVVRERLAVIEAKDLSQAAAPPPVVAAGVPSYGPPAPASVAPEPAAATTPPEIPAPHPAPPSRSLPQPVAADGTPIPLPPLPDEQVTPAQGSASDEPLPSPQSRPDTSRTSAPHDPASKKANYQRDSFPSRSYADVITTVEQGPLGRFTVNLEKDRASQSAKEARSSGWSPARPYSIRIPLPSGDVLEVTARAVLRSREAEGQSPGD